MRTFLSVLFLSLTACGSSVTELRADAGADAAADAEPAPLVVRDLSRRAGPAAACYCSPKARRMPRRGERSVAGLRR